MATPLVLTFSIVGCSLQQNVVTPVLTGGSSCSIILPHQDSPYRNFPTLTCVNTPPHSYPHLHPLPSQGCECLCFIAWEEDVSSHNPYCVLECWLLMPGIIIHRSQTKHSVILSTGGESTLGYCKLMSVYSSS